MKKRLYTLVTFSVTGIGIGTPVTLICMTLIGGFNDYIAEFLVWTVASVLFGLISGVVFYTKNNLSLPAATAIHCIGCLAVATAAGAICGYGDSFLSLLAGFLPVFVVVYVLIYGFVYLMMKLEAKQINQELNKE